MDGMKIRGGILTFGSTSSSRFPAADIVDERYRAKILVVMIEPGKRIL
jgi:hypothetical protein